MTVFRSKIATGSETFRENREAMLGLVAKLREFEARAEQLSEKRRPRFEERGQLTPRERLARLLDPGMPFLALHTMANFLAEDPNIETSVPGASLIAGIGFVGGVRCLVWVDDSGIRAGAMTDMGMPAVLSVQTIAKRQKLPLIHCVESAGANLVAYKVHLWSEAGAVFRNLAQMSAMGLPTLAVLHGPSTAGGAYMPGLSDYVVGIRKNGMAALAGRALTQAATGEQSTDAELGGAEMHATTSGVVEYLAEDDAEGLAQARRVFSGLNWNDSLAHLPERSFEEPAYSVDEIAGVVPRTTRFPMMCVKSLRGLWTARISRTSSPVTAPQRSVCRPVSTARQSALLGTTGQSILPGRPRRRNSSSFAIRPESL